MAGLSATSLESDERSMKSYVGPILEQPWRILFSPCDTCGTSCFALDPRNGTEALHGQADGNGGSIWFFPAKPDRNPVSFYLEPVSAILEPPACL